MRPFQDKSRDDFLEDPYLRDIVERNLEIAAQCCIDISHRIIAIEHAQKPQDYYEAILRMGELGVTPPGFARQLAPMAGFRNILTHEYLTIDWGIIYRRLHNLDDFEQFASFVRVWLSKRLDS